MPYSHSEASADNNPVLQDILNVYTPSMWDWFEDIVAPTFVNNGALSGKIPMVDTDNARKEKSLYHAPGEDPVLLDLGAKEYQDYHLTARSASFIQEADEDKRLRQAGMDPELEMYARAEGLKLKILMERHSDLYTLVSTEANYNSNCVTVAGTSWDDASADPQTNVRANRIAQRDNYGIVPTDGVINEKTKLYLETHTNIISSLSDDKLKVATLDEIAQLFGLKRLHVTNAQYDSSKPLGTPSFTDIWGAIMLLFYRPKDLGSNSSLRSSMQFARTIRNDDETFEVTSKDIPEKSPMKGGYCITHTCKAGYDQARMISIDTSSDSVCGGIITGLY